MEKLWRWFRSEKGQSTTEYALVILAVVAIAGLLSTLGVKGMSEFITKVFTKLIAGIQ